MGTGNGRDSYHQPLQTTTAYFTTTTTTTQVPQGYYIQYYGFGDSIPDAYADYTGSVKGQIWYEPSLGYFTDDTLSVVATEGTYLITYNANINLCEFISI